MHKSLYALLIAAGPLAFGAAHAGPVQWNGGPNANGHWYEYVMGPHTWDEALAQASKLTHLGQRGYLATVTSAEENAFIANLGYGHFWAWLGGSDRGSEGNWTWRAGPEAGQAFNYHQSADWANNAFGGQDVLAINSYIWQDRMYVYEGQSGRWNDFGELNSVLAHVTGRLMYVVEYGGMEVPEPTSLALVLGGLIAAGSIRRRAR